MYILIYKRTRDGYPYVAFGVPSGELLTWSDEQDAETWARASLPNGTIWQVKPLPDLWDNSATAGTLVQAIAA